jgi:hypothetical protein
VIKQLEQLPREPSPLCLSQVHMAIAIGVEEFVVLPLEVNKSQIEFAL